MKNCFFALWFLLLGSADAYISITNFMLGRTFVGCLFGLLAILMVVCMILMIIRAFED